MKHLEASRACIKAHGGPVRMAARLGVGVGTVKGWATYGIPTKHSVEIERRSHGKWKAVDLSPPRVAR